MLLLASELLPNANALSASHPEVNLIFQVQSQKNHRQVQQNASAVMQQLSIDGIQIHWCYTEPFYI